MIGVTFGTYDSKAWGIVLQSSTIGFPTVKTETIDVPGMDGVLDFTEALTGSATYGTRQLQFDFCLPGDAETWPALVSDIAAAIHGKKLRIIRDSDPDYYYTGRCYLEDFTSAERIGQMTITVDADPYKTHISTGEHVL